MSRIYTAGVFDLFHVGHLRALQLAKSLGNQLVVGVVRDEVAASYKRMPVIPYPQRFEIIQGLACVDEVVEGPLYTPEAFYRVHRISLHVQGENDPTTDYYADGRRLGIMRFVGRQEGIDSTKIIQTIIRRGIEGIDNFNAETKQSRIVDTGKL